MRSAHRNLALVGLAVFGGAVAFAQSDPFAFMPDGGRQSFGAVFPAADTQAWALSQKLTAEDWAAEITGRAPDLSARTVATLAAYLSVISPVKVAPDTTPDTAHDMASNLPPDGRDLALTQCQSCHSLFSGYLMHRRDKAGWLATFSSPFHMVLTMSDTEKTIFADYSAINMPMRFEDVPPELRF